jgi:hypothetical protein
LPAALQVQGSRGGGGPAPTVASVPCLCPDPKITAIGRVFSDCGLSFCRRCGTTADVYAPVGKGALAFTPAAAVFSTSQSHSYSSDQCG